MGMFNFSEITDNIIFKNNNFFFFFVLTGAFGAVAEGEFRRSLHCLDSHKGSACLRGVGAEVRDFSGRFRLIHPSFEFGA